MKVVHLILCSTGYEPMYMATRHYYASTGIETYYYMYGTKDETRGDVIRFFGKETYIPGILEKTLHAFSRFPEADYIIRSNISTVVDVQAVCAELEARPVDYAGSFFHYLNWIDRKAGIVDRKYWGMSFASGTCIILSKKAVQALLCQPVDATLIDDVAIGVSMQQAHIPHTCFKKHYLDSGGAYRCEPHVWFYRNCTKNRAEDAAKMQWLCDQLIAKYDAQKPLLGFDPAWYAEHNQDVAKEYGTDVCKLYQHWVTWGQREGRKCNPDYVPLKDEHGNILETFKHEVEEQKLALEHIEPNDVVLELGARYGSVSVIINQKLDTKHNHVAVEPDERVWSVLQQNLECRGAKATVWRGFVTRRELNLDSRTPSITIDELQAQTHLVFNVLVANCERGLLQFLEDAPALLPQLRMIIFGKDCPDTSDYGKVEGMLRAAGLEPIARGFQSIWKRQQMATSPQIASTVSAI